MPKGNVKPNALFDYFVNEKGMANDAATARKANILPSSISKVRNGNHAVSDETRIALMRAFGLSLAKLDELAPPVAKRTDKDSE